MPRKILNLAQEKVQKYKTLITTATLSDSDFLKTLNNHFSSIAQVLKKFKNKQESIFFLKSNNKEEIVKIIKSEIPKTIEDTVRAAEKICGHFFNLLGSGEINLDAFTEENGGQGKCGYLPWHFDFKTGYKWNSKKFYKDIKIPYGKADIKVPWELSLFQHFSVLGQAYWLTGDEKYVNEFVDQVNDWIDNNKPKFGVNWRCTMDVAIRACNWILGYYYFKNSPEITDEFMLKLLKSIYKHGKHIRSNLEYSLTLTSNHYISDIVGLIFISVIFPEFKEAEKWRVFAIKKLRKEMEKQVYPDGCDFEASTCYHRLVLELFFFSTLLVVINDNNFDGENYREISQDVFGKDYTDKLYKMFDATCYLLKPNGRMPQIGDNDSGQLFKLYPREVLDMRYLLALGAVFFKESKWKIKEFFNSVENIAEVLIVYAGKGKEIWNSLEWNSIKNIKSKAFPDAGWYVMRNDRNYCIISCGSNGQNGVGGHCHNDKLSFELCIDSEDVIVDPGTYVYTSDIEARNRFRSTAYHNTVMIDGEGQNRFDKNNVFSMKNDTLPKCLKWEIGDEVDIFIGEHYGYERLSKPVIHRREIRFYKKEGKLEITDIFEGKGEHDLKWNFILSPDFKRELKINSDKTKLVKKTFFYSNEYGIHKKTKNLKVALKTSLPIEITLNIDKV